MFKNRVRTAALAGAIAVATGVSGLTVPANAVELPTANTGLHFNDNDGSALLTGGTAYKPTATQTAEDQIVAETNKVNDFLATEVGTRNEVRASYFNLFASKDPNRVLDPSEQAAKEAFDKRAAQVADQLKASDKNERDIRASIRAALDLDEAAAKAYDDWNADYITAVNVTKDPAKVKAINALVDQLNDANKAWTSPVGAPDTGKIAYRPVDVTVTKTGDRFEYQWANGGRRDDFIHVVANDPASFAALAAQIEIAYLHASGYDAKEILSGEYGWPVAGKFNAAQSDSEPENFIRRELVPALDAIRAQSDIATFRAAVEAKKSKEAALTAAIYEAQRSDVLVLQSLLRRAEAQTRLLRIIEADYRVLARYVDLYENDTLVPVNGDQVSLRGQYRAVVDGFEPHIQDRFNVLSAEEANWWSQYQTFTRDLENPKAEIEEYDKDKKKFAQDVFSKILNDEQDWMNNVSRVELLDAKYHPNSPQNVGSLEAEQKAAKEESEMRNAFTKWLNSQTGTSNNDGKGSNQDGKGSDQNNGGNGNGRGEIKGSTIAAIVIGVLAALGGIVAVAFPHIQQFLPKF